MRRYNHKRRHKQCQFPTVKNFDDAHEMNSVNACCSRIGEDRDQHVLLHVEIPRIQCELKLLPFEEHSHRHRRRHQVAQRNHRDLRRDRRHGQRFSPVPEELVEEREKNAS